MTTDRQIDSSIDRSLDRHNVFPCRSAIDRRIDWFIQSLRRRNSRQMNERWSRDREKTKVGLSVRSVIWSLNNKEESFVVVVVIFIETIEVVQDEIDRLGLISLLLFSIVHPMIIVRWIDREHGNHPSVRLYRMVCFKSRIFMHASLLTEQEIW